MRPIDADALVNNINERIENMTSVGIAIDTAYLWALIFDEINEAPTIEPSKSADQNVENVPSGDLISRADAIDSINKTNSTLDEIPICKDIRSAFANAIKALPSADRPRGEWMSDETVPIEDVWQGVQPLKDKILELEEKLYLQNEKQKAQTINWSHDQISRAEVLALINKAMYNTDNKDIQDYLFCGLRRDVHHLPSADRPQVNSNSAEEQIAETCDRPKGDPEPEPAPVVAYICDRRRCAICRGPDGGCDHTTDIKHAAHFKNVAGQYFERPYMGEEDDG